MRVHLVQVADEIFKAVLMGNATGVLIAQPPFADQRRSIPIVYGRDVHGWWSSPMGPTNATVAWTGTNQAAAASEQTLRLFKMTWENPEPDVEIRALDFRSEGQESAAFLIAITAE